MRVATLESALDPQALNQNSQASGLFQFIPSTAEEYNLDNPQDIAAATQAFARLWNNNKTHLQNALGREPTDTELYLAHQQGAGGAAGLLKDPDRTALSALAEVYGSEGKAKAAIEQNGGSIDMTAGEFAQKWFDKYNGALGDTQTAARNGVTYNQSDTPRGSFTRLEQGKNLIKLYENADKSTFLHESGHFFLETMRDIAGQDGVAEDIANDYDSLLQFIGAKDGNIEREHHEKFARAFEAYLREGKAPSVELEGAFDRFRTWLTRVYRNVMQLDVTLTKDVRGLMDRMLATEDQITQARQRALFEPSPELAPLLTKAEFNDYVKRGEMAAQKARDTLLKKAIKEQERETAKAWKDARTETRARIAAEVDAEPVYKAQAAASENKLSRKAVEDAIGKEGRQKLPRGVTVPKGGIDPDIFAEINGFSSAAEMYEKLLNAEPKKSRIERLTDEDMKRVYGDMLSDGRIEDEAARAVNNTLQEQNMAAELRTVSRAAGQEATPIQKAKDAAERIIGAKPAHQAGESAPYLHASLRHAREFGKFLAKKDYENAAKHKRLQILNYYLYKEALRAKKDINTIEAKARTFLKEGTRKTIEKPFRDQIDAILHRFQFKTSADVQVTEVPWIEFVAAREDEGDMIFSPDVMRSSTEKPFMLLTMDELRDVRDTMKSLQRNGREAKSIRIEGQMVTARAAAEAAAESIADNNPLITRNRAFETRLDKAREFVGGLNNSILRPEFIMKALDGDKVNGKVAQALLNPLADAQQKATVCYVTCWGSLRRRHKQILISRQALSAKQVSMMKSSG